MSTAPIPVAVIVGSTREGRFGDTVARWFVSRVRRRADVALDVIDLAVLCLPAVHTALPGPVERAFARRVRGAEAFVTITPEYNHAYPASLKFALDCVKEEWSRNQWRSFHTAASRAACERWSR